MSLLTIQALRRDMEEGKERARPEDGQKQPLWNKEERLWATHAEGSSMYKPA